MRLDHAAVAVDVMDVQAKAVMHAGDVASAGTALVNAQAQVHLVITPHAVSLVGQRQLSLPLLGGSGDTLAGLLARSDVDMSSKQWVLAVGGVIVPRGQWGSVKPKAGQLIEARIRAGEFITATIAAISAWISTITIQSVLIAVGKGLLQLAGSMLLNKLLAPPKKQAKQQQQVEQTYAVTGIQNQQRPYDMVPIVFGNTRVGLDYFGQPYASFEGSEQYFYAWFSCGINGGSWLDAKIGNTSLSSYNEATLKVMGFSQNADDAMAVYTNVDTFAGGQLLAPSSSTPITRTTNAGTVMLALDFEAQVFGINGNGSMANNQFIDYHATYRLLPFGAAQPFFDASNNQGLPVGFWADSVRIYSQSTKPVRNSFTRPVPEGAYEVVVNKVTLDLQTSTQTNIGTLTAVRGFQKDNSEDYRIGRFSLRIRASGQLNGAVDQLSVHVYQKPIPLWNGAAWITSTTSNLGAVLLQLIRGIYDNAGRLLGGFGYADSRIDVESFKGFILHCAARGFEFNHWQTDLVSCEELAEQMARTGLGSLSRHSGKLGVIWFNESQPLEGIINMATIKRGSFSVDYFTGQSADELEISYSDQPSAFALPQEKTIRVQSPVASSFLNVGRMRFDGVRNAVHAALLGRFSMAQNVYQRKSISLEMDYEFISYRRGSLLALSHDLTQWGYSGRLKAAVNNAGTITLTLDEAIPSINPTGSSVTKMIGLRLLGEQQYRIFTVNNFTGPNKTIVLAGGWPGGATLPGSLAGEAAFECVWIYDFKATPGLRARVVSIEPQGNESGARITLVPEPDQFWPYVNSGSYLPAPNNSLLDRSLPVVSNIKVVEQLDLVGVVYLVRLFITFRISGAMDRAEIWGKWGDNSLAKLGETRNTDFESSGLTGQIWAFQIRPFDALGRPGAALSLNYTVIGKLAAPQSMANFQLAMGTNGVQATWNDPTAVDPDWQAAELSTDVGFAMGSRVTFKKSLTHLIGYLTVGTRTFYGRIWDEDRASLAGVSSSITIAPPANVILQRVDVNANVASLRWADSKTSQPILTYNIKIGTPAQTYAQAQQWGSQGSDSRSDLVTAPAAGSYLIWIVAIDVAGNPSQPTSVPVTFTLPTDFVLANRFDATFAGAGVNATVNGGRVWLLWQAGLFINRYSRNGSVNAAAKIAAGKLRYFEPGALTSSYSEDYDLGAVVPTTTIKLAYQTQWMAGSGTVDSDIAYKTLLSDVWTTLTSVTQIIASAVRYVRITIRATGAGNDDLLRLVSMFTECSSQRIYEPFELTLNAADVNGTPYVTTAGFTDIKTATANPLGTGNAITRAPVPVIDDAGPIKRVLWLGYDAAGNRASGPITGQISGV